MAQESIRGIEHFRGSDAARAALLEHDFVVTGPAQRYVFDPLRDAKLPIYVGPDQLIAAYAKLLQAAQSLIEEVQEPALARFSSGLLERARVEGWTRTERLAEFAALLLRGEAGESLDRALAQLIADESVDRRALEAALERCRVELADTVRPAAASRFRAGWLWWTQVGWDRADAAHRRELEGIREALGETPELAADWQRALRSLSLLDARAAREDITSRLTGFLSQSVPGTDHDRLWRLVGPVRTWDAAFFESLPGPELSSQAAEECCALGRLLLACDETLGAGEIGGSLAGEALVALGREGAATPVEGPYRDALRATGLLHAQSGLTGVFATDAWRARLCASQLALWAELRRVHASQIHVTILSASVSEPPPLPPPGFVAPYPDYYRAMAALARDVAKCVVDALQVDDAQLRDRARFADENFEAGRLFRHRMWNHLHARGSKTDPFTRLVRRIRDDPDTPLTDEERAMVFASYGGSFAAQRGLVDLAMFCEEWARVADLRGVVRRIHANEVGTRAWFEQLDGRLAALHGLRGDESRWPPAAPRYGTRVAEIADEDGSATVATVQVGLAAPRRLYVVVERDGARWLAIGGALDYREVVSPAEASTESPEVWATAVESSPTRGVPPFVAPFRRD